MSRRGGLVLILCTLLSASSCGRGGDDGSSVTSSTMFARTPVGERIDHLVMLALPEDESGQGSDEARACVAQSLVSDAGLVEALRDDAQASPRFVELRGIGERCSSAVTHIGPVMDDLRSRSDGRLSAGQATCLQNVLVTYPVEDQRELREVGLVDVAAGLRGRVDELLLICGVERSLFG